MTNNTSVPQVSPTNPNYGAYTAPKMIDDTGAGQALMQGFSSIADTLMKGAASIDKIKAENKKEIEAENAAFYKNLSEGTDKAEELALQAKEAQNMDDKMYQFYRKNLLEGVRGSAAIASFETVTDNSRANAEKAKKFQVSAMSGAMNFKEVKDFISKNLHDNRNGQGHLDITDPRVKDYKTAIDVMDGKFGDVGADYKYDGKGSTILTWTMPDGTPGEINLTTMDADKMITVPEIDKGIGKIFTDDKGAVNNKFFTVSPTTGKPVVNKEAMKKGVEGAMVQMASMIQNSPNSALGFYNVDMKSALTKSNTPGIMEKLDTVTKQIREHGKDSGQQMSMATMLDKGIITKEDFNELNEEYIRVTQGQEVRAYLDNQRAEITAKDYKKKVAALRTNKGKSSKIPFNAKNSILHAGYFSAGDVTNREGTAGVTFKVKNGDMAGVGEGTYKISFDSMDGSFGAFKSQASGAGQTGSLPDGVEGTQLQQKWEKVSRNSTLSNVNTFLQANGIPLTDYIIAQSDEPLTSSNDLNNSKAVIGMAMSSPKMKSLYKEVEALIYKEEERKADEKNNLEANLENEDYEKEVPEHFNIYKVLKEGKIGYSSDIASKVNQLNSYIDTTATQTKTSMVGEIITGQMSQESANNISAIFSTEEQKQIIAIRNWNNSGRGQKGFKPFDKEDDITCFKYEVRNGSLVCTGRTKK